VKPKPRPASAFNAWKRHPESGERTDDRRLQRHLSARDRAASAGTSVRTAGRC
jgi:hypothetical protein